MKKLFLILILIANNLSYSQVVQPEPDSLSIVQDTIVLESVRKSEIGDRIGRFLGIDNEEEIRNLKETIGYQQQLIEELSNMSIEPTVIIKEIPNLNAEAAASLKKDASFLSDLPKSYNNLPKTDLAKITKQIDAKIAELIKQRDSLFKHKGNEELISAKDNVINSLNREKKVINLSIESGNLKNRNSDLNNKNINLIENQSKLRKYLYASLAILFVLVLIIAVVLQRKKIKVQDIEIDKQLSDINKKNAYLEHAARIIRHDMHSGINTYIPRGISALEKRISDEDIERLKIKLPLTMIRDGLSHTQRVYKNVYEFTNLVKQNIVLEKTKVNLHELINNYVYSNSYSSQVEIDELPDALVNSTLFCAAIDNFIKNGLTYNKSEKKWVKIYMKGDSLIIQDNGVGLTTEKFNKICSSYSSKDNESAGLGLNISVAILSEHGYETFCEKNDIGTKIKIKIKE